MRDLTTDSLRSVLHNAQTHDLEQSLEHPSLWVEIRNWNILLCLDKVPVVLFFLNDVYILN